MNKTKYMKPAHEGLLVRFPRTMTPLPAHGATVEWNSYWRRRWKDGSVVIADPPGQKTYPGPRREAPQREKSKRTVEKED